MKQLVLSLLLLSTTTLKSQDTVKIPVTVVKQIVKDLISYDSALIELKLTQEQLGITEQKSSIKDSIITTYKNKTKTYQEQIDIEKAKLNLWQEQYTFSQKENKKLKSKLITFKVISGIVIASIIYFKSW